MEGFVPRLKTFVRKHMYLNAGFVIIICLVSVIAFARPLTASHAAVDWSGNMVAYSVGDEVVYEGHTYKCIQAHTSLPNWTPDVVAALWQLEPDGGSSDNQVTFDQGVVGVTVTPTVAAAAPGIVPASGSHTLTTGAPPLPTANIMVKATVYTDNTQAMYDGVWPYDGACAVDPSQFPFHTEMDLYTSDGTFLQHCVAEDIGTNIHCGDLDLAKPGDNNIPAAINWGVRLIQVKVTSWGDNSTTWIARPLTPSDFVSPSCTSDKAVSGYPALQPIP